MLNFYESCLKTFYIDMCLLCRAIDSFQSSIKKMALKRLGDKILRASKIYDAHNAGIPVKLDIP